MARDPAVELVPGVVRIPTVGAAGTNSYAVRDDAGGITLVDCGLRWALRRIVAGLRAVGAHPGDVRRIVLTHAHTDHAGGAVEMAARSGAAVAVQEAVAAAVGEGRHAAYDPSPRLGRLMTRLPGGRFPPARVDERLVDGRLLDGGLRVVATPGHTPGSICLVHEQTGTLIVGDTLLHTARLRPSRRAICTDHRQNERSARLLGELGHERVAFTHGPEIVRDARGAVRRAVEAAGGRRG